MSFEFNNTNATLNNLIQIFQNLADSHQQINDFFFGDVWDLQQSTTTNYPLFAVTLLDNELGENTITYKFRLYIMDLIQPDNSNESEVKSNSIILLNGVFHILRDYYDLEPDHKIKIQPFVEKFNDRVGGAYADVSIMVPSNFGYCNEPFASLSGNTFIPLTPDNCRPILLTENTPSISFGGNGSGCEPLFSNVNLSSKIGNDLFIFEDGLYSSGATEVSLVWGAIGGTLSNQTDLQIALNLKLENANNGLLINGTTVQFGQTNNADGDPAALLFPTEIPFGGFTLNFVDRGLGNSIQFDPNQANIIINVSGGLFSENQSPLFTIQNPTHSFVFGGGSTPGREPIDFGYITYQGSNGFSGQYFLDSGNIQFSKGSTSANDTGEFIQIYGNVSIVDGTQQDGYILTSNPAGRASWQPLPTGVSSLNTRTGDVTLISSDVTTALGFTPYNSTNPVGYLSSINSSMIISALGFTPYNATNPNNYISSITGINAGGDLSGTYPNPTLLNSAVIGKVLTGYTSGAGTISASDSLLTAIEKLNGNIGALITGVSSVSNSDSSLNISPTSGAVVASLNVGHSNLWTAEQTINLIALSGTTADALLIENTSSATNGNQQVTPAIHFKGGGFATTPVASQSVDFRQFVLPVQGAANPTGVWHLQSSINGGAFADVLTIDSAGNFTNTGLLQIGLNSGEAGGIKFVAAAGTQYSNTTGGGGFYHQFMDNNFSTIVAKFLTSTSYFNCKLFVGGTTTATSLLHVGASTTSAASLRIVSGTAPTSPNDGDIWYDGTNLKMRVGSTTKTFTLT